LEQSPSEAKSHSANQEIPHLPWNMGVHYLAHNIPPIPRPRVTFRNRHFYYGELLAPRPNPKLENRPLSAVRDCLFSILATTLHIWERSPPTATQGCTTTW